MKRTRKETKTSIRKLLKEILIGTKKSKYGYTEKDINIHIKDEYYLRVSDWNLNCLYLTILEERTFPDGHKCLRIGTKNTKEAMDWLKDNVDLDLFKMQIEEWILLNV